MFARLTTTTVRRIAAGLTLIGALLVGLSSTLVTPRFSSGMEGELAFVAAHPTRYSAGFLLVLLTFFLLGPAIFALLPLLRRRGALLAHVGAPLALVGCYFHGAIIGFALTEVPIAPRADALALSHVIYDHPVFMMVLMPFFGFYLGYLLLTIALWRAGVIRWWIGAIIVVGLLSEFIGPSAWHPIPMFVGLLIGLGSVGRTILQMSDDAWVRGPVDAPHHVDSVRHPALVG